MQPRAYPALRAPCAATLYSMAMDKFERAENMTPNERAEHIQSAAIVDRAEMSPEVLEMVERGSNELARRRAPQ